MRITPACSLDLGGEPIDRAGNGLPGNLYRYIGIPVRQDGLQLVNFALQLVALADGGEGVLLNARHEVADIVEQHG